MSLTEYTLISAADNLENTKLEILCSSVHLCCLLRSRGIWFTWCIFLPKLFPLSLPKTTATKWNSLDHFNWFHPYAIPILGWLRDICFVPGLLKTHLKTFLWLIQELQLHSCFHYISSRLWMLKNSVRGCRRGCEQRIWKWKDTVPESLKSSRWMKITIK